MSWDEKQCRWVSGSRRFYWFSAFIFKSQQPTKEHSPGNIAPLPRTLESWATPLWAPQKSHILTQHTASTTQLCQHSLSNYYCLQVSIQMITYSFCIQNC